MVKKAWRFGIDIECLVEVSLAECLEETEVVAFKQVESLESELFPEASNTTEEQNNIRDRIYKKIYDDIVEKLGKILKRTAPSENIRVYREDDESTHSYNTWMLEFDSENPWGWRSSTRAVLEAFNSAYGMKVNKSCGMHVHISPISGIWDLDSLKKLSYCILWFEEALEQLYPDERRQTSHLGKANYAHNPRFQTKISDDANLTLEKKQVKKELSNCFSLIASKPDIESLVQLMNPPARTTINPSNQPDRYYAWNFTSLMEGNTRSIEFRRPPSKTKSKDCEPWVWLAVAFVDAAVQINPVQIIDNKETLMYRYPDRTVEQLKVFLGTSLRTRGGRGTEHMKIRHVCKPIFSHAHGKMEVQAMQPLTDADLYAMEEKKDKKKVAAMKLRMVNANERMVEHVVAPQIESEVVEDDEEND